MMKLTYQKGKGTKIHISLDDEYTITTDADFWYLQGIRNGDEISEENWEPLKWEITCRRAVMKAMDFLSRRDHSRQELVQKLRRTYDGDAADYAADQMVERGYVDDAAFAERMAAYYINTKHYGRQRCVQELRKKGIARDLIDFAVEQVETDPAAEAFKLLQTKYVRSLGNEAGRRRATAALVRLGYRYDEIRTAMRQAQDELNEEDIWQSEWE